MAISRFENLARILIGLQPVEIGFAQAKGGLPLRATRGLSPGWLVAGGLFIKINPGRFDSHPV